MKTEQMKIWLEAARPKTLVTGAVPVLVGTAAAGRVVPWRLGACLVAALSVQVGANYANDYFDGTRGVDSPDRIGPRRVTSARLVTARQMKRAIAAAFAVASVAGLALAAAVGPELIVVGTACFGAALAYSGGRRPFGAAGWGEVAVFVFFGLVATVGSAYVQVERIPALAVAASVPVGLLASAILAVNNIRDIPTDHQAGKRTLAVRLGRTQARRLYRGLVLAPFLSAFGTALAFGRPWALLTILALPFARRPLRLVASREDGPGLIRALVGTVRLQLVFSLLLAGGLWVF
ncbi:MAG: 1,4-dihydroxy-2-naphthoate polyprenyltransferase [Actinomycetota bacterium]